MSRINFMLSRVEHEKSLITLDPGFSINRDLRKGLKSFSLKSVIHSSFAAANITALEIPT